MSGRRSLQGFAYNIAQKFSVSAEHFAWLALDNKESVMTADLLTGAISPPVFDIERNRTLINMCGENLREIVTKAFPAELNSAVLTARFGLEPVGHFRGYARISAVYEVILVEESGVEVKGVVEDAGQIVCP
ncbi:MAG: hypothetical protein ACYC69_02960 [Thermodesulfovibrionales bacterium]